MKLKGKTAMITGGAVRLGAAICRALAKEGVNIVIHYNRSQKEAEKLCGELKELGIWCAAYSLDFREPETIEDFFASVVRERGPIDILVNSASLFREDTILSLAAKSALEAYASGAIAPLLLSRAFAAQNLPGSIVNILDARMVDYDRNHVSYSLSKQALHSLTRMMSVEFAPALRVNAVAPGYVYFSGMDSPKTVPAALESCLLDRLPSIEDVVSSVIFLLTNEAVTGQVIYPDGGRNFKGSMYG